MIETKYKQEDVVYLVRGTAFTKCVVDEIHIHYTQTNIIVKYMVRPYGSKDYIAMSENELVKTLKEAKEKVRHKVADDYTASMENIENITEEFFDDKEKAYQLEKE